MVASARCLPVNATFGGCATMLIKAGLQSYPVPDEVPKNTSAELFSGLLADAL
jgi:hypothetical protein